MFTGKLGELHRCLKQLPGVGNKTAQRLALHIIQNPAENSLALADAIGNAVRAYKNCSVCNFLSEEDPCDYCTDTTRAQNILCVVKNSHDVHLIEKTGSFKGRYFVLGNLLSPIDGIGPREINFPKLHKIIAEGNIKELVLAINPSTSGETTISYIAQNLAEFDVNITRLSTGIPFGGDIEYTNPITLNDALLRRYSI